MDLTTAGAIKRAKKPKHMLKRVWQRFFTHGIPEYLARYYWWAYLWKAGVWLFDHHFMINAILFGQYKKLVNTTVKQLQQAPVGEMLQVSCVYGSLTPTLVNQLPHQQFHLIDVAPIQLTLTKNKLLTHGDLNQQHTRAAIMNAEYLAYCNNCFDSALIFFLLHELPKNSREHVINETLRILRPHGRLIICEYGEFSSHHFLHQCWPIRFFIGKLEPFLPDFWHSNLDNLINHCAEKVNKNAAAVAKTAVFSGFYRVVEYQITAKQNTRS